MATTGIAPSRNGRSGRMPPSNLDAEKCVLGSIILDPSRCEDVARILSPSQFYSTANSLIYRAMLAMQARGGAIDVKLLVDELTESGNLAEVGDTAYLGEVAGSVPVAAHATYYADIVAREARRRELIYTLTAAVDEVESGKIDADTLTERLKADLDEVKLSTADESMEWLDLAGLVQGDFSVDYHVEGILAKRQPTVLSGPSKTLKTSLAVDLGVSLATQSPFLEHFHVPTVARVGFVSGESGMSTMRNTFLRVLDAKQLALDDVGDRLIITGDVPVFGNPAHETAIKSTVAEHGLDLLILDPLYMSLSRANMASLTEVGDVLRRINALCDDLGCTLLALHHSVKRPGAGTRDPYGPPQREDVHGAGIAEWCRQWIQLGRREPYQPGTGRHALWLSVGGSPGHSGLWHLDIDEGLFSHETRSLERWDVTVTTATEATRNAEARKEEEQEQRAQERLEKDMKKVCEVIAKFPGGETKSFLQVRSGINPGRFNVALAELLADEDVVECDINKANRKTPYTGYQLAE